jgi:protein SCO1/2
MNLLPCLVLCSMLALAEAAVLSTGDSVPDCELTDQNGRPLRLSQFKGQALALTFIFTRCPLADYCPRMTAHFAAVQRAMGGDKNWHLLSLSFDPEYDTPEKLLAYARAHGADTSRWTFATAKPDVVKGLGAWFGLEARMKDGLIDHNLRTVVIDAEGRVQHIFQGNTWTPQELIWELRKAMR